MWRYLKSTPVPLGHNSKCYVWLVNGKSLSRLMYSSYGYLVVALYDRIWEVTQFHGADRMSRKRDLSNLPRDKKYLLQALNKAVSEHGRIVGRRSIASITSNIDSRL